MFDFFVGLIIGLGVGVGVCAWVVWAVLTPEMQTKNNEQHAQK
jgi:hypothetical protein